MNSEGPYKHSTYGHATGDLTRCLACAYAEGRKSTEKELDKMKEELEVANRLLEGRDRLLDLFECKDHGQGCVPDAVEKVIKMQKDFQELLEFTSRKCYRDGDRADFIAWKKARGLK